MWEVALSSRTLTEEEAEDPQLHKKPKMTLFVNGNIRIGIGLSVDNQNTNMTIS